MTEAVAQDQEKKPWKPHPISRSAFSVVAVLFYLSQMSIGVAVYYGNYWVAIPLVLFCGHFMHGLLIGFHEASHGMLRKNKKFNDIEGTVIGIFSFTCFTLYRAAHQAHHMHLASRKDIELWPFNQPEIPRWRRVLAACIELTFGLFFTPFIFMRAFLEKDSIIRSQKVRKKIWREIILMIVVWALVITGVTLLGGWSFFLWMFALPALIAGNLQSWRKYIEHVGLTGNTIKSGTRSIVADNWLGKAVSFTLLHEPYHGVHHINMGLPHAELPGHTDLLKPANPEELPPFKSYGHAVVHLLKSLGDPKVGPQWNEAQQEEAAPASS